ncbi:MAG: orotidine-5'-phosphate decarboxylase [Wolinella sp.]
MQLCVALDLPSKEENLRLLRELRGLPLWIKVGLRSFIRDGREFLEEITGIDEHFRLFLDLKLYDIPNTMGDALEEIAKLNVGMLTLHASSGAEAMKECSSRLAKVKNRPLLFAVSALTSFSEEGFREVYNASLESKALDMAMSAAQNGIDGVVCSVFESARIKSFIAPNFLTLTPGIRPFGEPSNDQKRVANINEAKQAMSDFIVVGRPIYQNKNPREVVENILVMMD